ncbi:MAG TPA: hypothetical protein VFL04_06775 [Rectinemataceae bacterium]|nr:hypothetical protein [Rectinemataceae bacterium]
MSGIRDLGTGNVARAEGRAAFDARGGLESLLTHLVSESYLLLLRSVKSSHDSMRTIYSEWNRGELADPLIAATADALGLRDLDGEPLLEKVLDVASRAEPCVNAAALAMDLGVPAPAFAQAAASSHISALKDERVDASAVLSGPKHATTGDRTALVEEIRRALLAATILAQAQAFLLLSRAAAAKGALADLCGTAQLWSEGRASFLHQRLGEALCRNPELELVILDAQIKALLDPCLPSLRRVVARSAESGLAVPVFAACLQFYDQCRSTWLPANLVRALRDARGGEGFERVDRPRGEIFHSDWK